MIWPFVILFLLSRVEQNRPMKSPLALLLTSFAVCLSLCNSAEAAGNSNGKHYGRNGTVRVFISPSSSNLQVGQLLQFSASVSGTSNTGLNWLVNGTVGGSSATGTISTQGMYTAPTVVPPGPITITAQSVAVSSAVANASISIIPAPIVGVSVSPTSANVQVGHSQQFGASVSGTSNTAVSWAVNGTLGGNSGVGTITSTGVYTAPSSVPAGQVTVTAQSAAQNSASATATVSVMPATVSVSITPTNVSVQTGQSQQFGATVSGASNSSVNWLVSGLQGGNSSVGTITSSGLYTAPATAPSASVIVTAQSGAVPGSSASASVSVTQPVSHSVNLTWNASTSSVAGYNIYRGTQPAGPYSKLNPMLETATVYTDSSVASGQTYYYLTTAVNSSGAESGYSNVAQVSIP